MAGAIPDAEQFAAAMPEQGSLLEASAGTTSNEAVSDRTAADPPLTEQSPAAEAAPEEPPNPSLPDDESAADAASHGTHE
jgi:hypothetical protein